MRPMLVSEIGEFQLIDELAGTIVGDNALCIERITATGFRLRLSIGDDAAAWEGPAGARVLTTDTMVEGVHFNLAQIGWRDLGWKSLVVNLSDIAAVGAAPLFGVVTLGLPGDAPVSGLKEMYRGMMEACRQHGGAIVGGDIVRSPVLFVTVALEGAARSGAPLLTRGSARPGDEIGVTGHLGCSGAGLRALTEGLRPGGDIERHLREAHFRPVPRVAEGGILVRRGVVAGMDVSDGLINDLSKMCESSGVGAMVHSEMLPADDFLRRAYPDDWLAIALSGGEDYELLFTCQPPLMEQIAAELVVPVTVIGNVVAGPSEVKVLGRDGSVLPVESGGWDHFRRGSSSLSDSDRGDRANRNRD